MLSAPSALALQFGMGSSAASQWSGSGAATSRAISISLSAWNGWSAAASGTSISFSTLDSGATLIRPTSTISQRVIEPGLADPEPLPGAPVPEPGAALLFAAGLAVSGLTRRRLTR